MNKNKKAKDPRRNNIFAAAFDYLKRTTDIETQQDLADRMGVTKDTISRIIRAKTDVTEDAITKLQTASGCIFNLQWLRGESDTMLANDADMHSAPVVENRHEPTQLPDYSSLMNATIAAQQTAIESLKRELADKEESAANAGESAKREIAAKEETISTLRAQLKDKDDTIATKDAQLKDKEAHIETLKRQIADLRSAIASQQVQGSIGNYPFTIGVADEGSRQQVTK